MTEDPYVSLKDIIGIIFAVNQIVASMGCSNPEHQKKIEELQAAMRHVKDLADRMEE